MDNFSALREQAANMSEVYKLQDKLCEFGPANCSTLPQNKGAVICFTHENIAAVQVYNQPVCETHQVHLEGRNNQEYGGDKPITCL